MMMDRMVLFLENVNGKRALLILGIITFGLRLYSVLAARGMAYDSTAYGSVARDFLKGDFVKGLSSPAHPFYPFLIYLISPDSAHVEIVGRVISLFFGTLTIVPLYYLAKEFIGEKRAILSSLFYAFHPYLVTYSGMLLTEATYWGLLTLSVYFFWTGLRREKVSKAILSGVFLSLAYLTRPEGMGYLLIFIIWGLFYGGFKKWGFKKIFFLGGVMLPFVILSSPYVIYIHHETGQWLISKKALDVQTQFLEEERGEDNPSAEKGMDGQAPVRGAAKFLEVVNNIVRFIPFTAYHYLRAYDFALWLFLFFGLFRARSGEGKDEMFFASLVFFHLFSLSIFTWSCIRFSVPMIPLSLFWAGIGASEIQKCLKRIRISNPEKLFFLLILLILLIQLPQSLKPERGHRLGQREVGLWLKQNTPKGAVIMSNSPFEAFYAEREFILLPPGISRLGTPGKSYREIIRFAREKGVNYILTNKNTSGMNPDFEASINPMNLKEFHRFKEKDRGWIIVYEVIY